MTDHVRDLVAAITRLSEVIECMGRGSLLVSISIDDGVKGMRLRSLLLSNYMMMKQGVALNDGRGCEIAGVKVLIAPRLRQSAT